METKLLFVVVGEVIEFVGIIFSMKILGLNTQNQIMPMITSLVKTICLYSIYFIFKSKFFLLGVVHNAVLYIVDDQNAEKFDFNANKWSYWDSPPKPVGFDPCMVELNSKLYLLGGSQHETGIQVLNCCK